MSALLLLMPFPLLAIAGGFILRSRAHTIYGMPDGKPMDDAFLPYSPTELTLTDIATIVLHIILRYLPFYGTASLVSTEEGFDLPLIRLRGPLRISRDDVRTFLEAITNGEGKVSRDRINPMLLVSLTTPLAIITLTHPLSPIKPIGAVNTKNTFVYNHPESATTVSTLVAASQANELSFSAEMGGVSSPGRRKKRGLEFDVTIKVQSKGQVILTQKLSYLQFLPRTTKPLFDEHLAKDEIPGASQLASCGLTTDATLEIPKEGPLKWAASCKDYNLIHVSTLAAKVFGFKGIIAHGNFVAAKLIDDALRVVPQFQGQKGEAVLKEDSASSYVEERTWSWSSAGAYENSAWTDKEPQNPVKTEDMVINVAFLKPVTPLPATLKRECRLGFTDEGCPRMEFEAHREGRSYVAGGIVLRAPVTPLKNAKSIYRNAMIQG